ncbi:hypothetical protein F441_04576 [Phytophthora nicotianae CJ01A1]|uniref:Uncharacterized protein n=4 Tax=Phytophthora nicotianae TaxID=4792 RepID=W2ZS89_PHYNI|nr:hypothetical protein L915_04474 [Phytophthora nicotianae]ETL45466.1 hypothetical protein L916_04444 [Phytophthora nicotianae]ETO80955.1 hypothetical protein F444_04632 [Phytophthora nicotianae P1976]ETP22023.1 hypothetical protein F441_04576 [Phytophthora nicotianae CJ01A1]ETP49871.1 hypothetical protein F442_04650 [Phytophthora nicotianae P10297]
MKAVNKSVAAMVSTVKYSNLITWAFVLPPHTKFSPAINKRITTC